MSSSDADTERPRYKKPSHNCVAFTRLLVDDLDRAQAFFSGAFGWTFVATPENGPRVCMTGGDVMLGLHRRSSSHQSQPEAAEAATKQPVVNYILVESVDEALKQVVRHGGRVTKDKFVEGDHTELAEFEDTEGNLHGVLKWLS